MSTRPARDALLAFIGSLIPHEDRLAAAGAIPMEPPYPISARAVHLVHEAIRDAADLLGTQQRPALLGRELQHGPLIVQPLHGDHLSWPVFLWLRG